MKKKLITLAVASTLVTAAAVSAPAFADTSNVNVYGVAHMSYDMTDNGNTNTNKVSSNQTRIGFKGSEDMGDGLSAVWQIEQMIALDNAGGTFATRNSFLGLSSGSMGTVLMGRHDTPYRMASRKVDVFLDTIADSRSLTGGVAGKSAGASFDGRQGDVVAYVSPAMSGFTGIIAYVAGAEAATVATTDKGSAWSMAALYGNGPLSANLGYEVHDFGTAGSGTLAVADGMKESAWVLNVGYTMDAIAINAAYESTSDNLGAAGADAFGHNTWHLSGKYSFGKDAVKLAYTNMGDMAAANTGATQISVGYDHNLSKRTSVYGLYTKLNNDTGSTFGFSGVTTGTTAAAAAGASLSAWSFGMRHTF